uniref:C2 domain-containing protein n=2 Tax=Cajanus cajan TaxID=3821 RepID=A0A151UCH5_CAJCA|nr:hypothetical protein KK1_021292 [Cajanus cajan]
MDRSQVAEKVYVVVRAESLNCCTTKMVNEDAGLLAWNEKFLLGIPSRARSITFEVQCKKYKDVRPIGVARIALSDFLSANKIVSESVPQMLCHGLTNWEGQRNGVIHFSVKEVTLGQHFVSEAKDMTTATMSSKEIEHEVMGIQADPKKSSHVASHWYSSLLEVPKRYLKGHLSHLNFQMC